MFQLSMLVLVFILASPVAAFATQEAASGGSTKPWWFWPLVLFLFCLVLGVLAVMAGVSGGILYVPLVNGFLPFHIDFVRGVGLMAALTGAPAAVEWKTHRTLLGLFMFILIGLLAGMFGLSAGCANAPVLNLMMGVPLKVSVATSKFLLSIADTSAAWIYMNRGCVIPPIAVPSIVGLMLGSLLGVRLLAIAKPKMIRYMVIGVLFFASLKAMDKGLGLGLLG
jgi:uncharacterized membrane protein YfcA